MERSFEKSVPSNANRPCHVVHLGAAANQIHIAILQQGQKNRLKTQFYSPVKRVISPVLTLYIVRQRIFKSLPYCCLLADDL